MTGAPMDELSQQREAVQQLCGLLTVSELPGDPLVVGGCLKRNRAKLALMINRQRLERAGGGRELQAVCVLIERLADAGMEAQRQDAAASPAVPASFLLAGKSSHE